ncbi:tryptophan-rich sensory protein [Dyadobacter psychrotolerans]|uniref:Tryptophan-rich sensory protein n=1 Tax=Dyadobacter psychrotolerans TaxID=2541721 RepID=A0A4V6PFN2_9BACT|nr:tryptophan-rich sensory protein [Dyadobacter psychrotolerans]TDE10208.1 hypothetical protein E0F88_28345 [Dyadobacter psychrotolerans]
MSDNKLERYATAALVIGSIVGTYFFSRPRKKNPVQTVLDRKQQKKIDRNLMTPANETFGIVWPVIYTGTIALAIHQALPSQRLNLRYQKAQPWLQASYLLTGIFSYFFSKSDKKNRIGAAVTTINMLPAAIGLHRSLEIGTTRAPEPENTLQKSISIYTGWLTAASAVSATTLVQEAGYFKKNSDAKKWATGLIPLTSAIGFLVSKRLNDPYYLLPIVAALAGIAVKQKDKNQELSVLSASLATALSGIAVAEIRKPDLSGIKQLSALI